MEEREPQRGKPEERWREEEREGGGPYVPGGDTEPSNWPGEARERGMEPPEPEPVPAEDSVDEAGEV